VAPPSQDAWRERWRGRRIIAFVDNDAARFALIKGSTQSSASAAMVARFWSSEVDLESYIWLERVTSASNVADGPSRLDFAEVKGLGGRIVEAPTIPVEDLMADESPWVGSGSA